MMTTVVILSIVVVVLAILLVVVLWDREKLYRSCIQYTRHIYDAQRAEAMRLRLDREEALLNMSKMALKATRAKEWAKAWKASAKAHRSASNTTWRKA